MNIQDSIAEIQLEAGEIVSVFDVYIRPTYGNLLAGTPNDKFNERLLTRLAQSTENGWQDDTPIFVLRPPADVVANQLPAFYMTALLDSPTHTNPESHGSKLRVVWFTENVPTNLVQHIQDSLHRLDRKIHAKDYQI